MLIPTWITLKKLPLHFFGVAQEIAASLGKVLGKDAQNTYFKDPKFCIALDTSVGWKTELEIEDRLTGKLIPILVDYANLPIRCRYCNDLNHQSNACLQKSGSARQPRQAPTSTTNKSPIQQTPEVQPQKNDLQMSKDSRPSTGRRGQACKVAPLNSEVFSIRTS